MVTAELAVCLPVLVLVLAFAVSVVSAVDRRARVQDAAAEAARAFARADPAAALRLARMAAPGVVLSVARSGSDVRVTATERMPLLASWLPGVTLSAHAVAALEPGTDQPDGAPVVPP
ncbi:MAG: TadE-like protein [Pseudonocardiales bacterium]|nr:TadE-like protein [Pseudonocardiales bacterium]